MKRLLLFALSLMAVTGMLRAQNSSHWSSPGGGYMDETFVYAELVLNGETVYDQSTYNSYEFAAFIGDELRGKGTVMSNPFILTTEAYILRFRVEGSLDTDDGEFITFKAYNPSTGLEYDLTVNTEEVMFTGETEAIPSSATQLGLTEPTSISLNNIYVNVGETVDPLQYVTVTPWYATLPNNIEWAYGQGGNNYYSFKNNDGIWGIKGVNPTTTGASVWMTYGSLDAEGVVYVYQPATAINRTQAELTVYLGNEPIVLDQLLQGTYELAPANTTDKVVWVSSNTQVVSHGDAWVALEAGDAVMTATVYDYDDNIRTGINPITVTVHVRQGVSSITTPYNSDRPLYCSPGDDLTAYIVDGIMFDVLPTEAYDKSVTFEVSPNNLALTVDANNHVIAKNVSNTYDYVTVRSISNPDVTCDVCVWVINEVRNVTFNQNELTIPLTSANMEITDIVTANINILPTDADCFNDNWLGITSSDPSVVEIVTHDYFGSSTNLPMTVTAKKAGTATITLEYRAVDYLGQKFGNPRWTGDTKTFTINVTCGVTGITSPFQSDDSSSPYEYLDCMLGDDLTSYFVDGKAFNIVPAAATNKAVTLSYYDPGADQHCVTIDSEGTITATQGGSEWILVTSVDNPQASTYVKVRVHDEFKTLTAPVPEYTVNFTGSGMNITEILDNAIVMGPEGSYVIYEGTDYANIYNISNPNVLEINDNGAFVKAVGTTTVTMTIKWKDWLAAEFDPTGALHETEVSASFTVIVSEGLTGLTVQYFAPQSDGNEGKIQVSSIPEGCTINPNLVEVTATYYDNDDWSNYMDNILEIGSFAVGDEEGTVWAPVTLKNIPGKVMFTATYPVGNDNISMTTDPQELGYDFQVNGGWEWRTIPYGIFKSLNSLFDDNLIEVRTQSEQVYNDPTYGLFGDLDLLSQNVCFKLKTESSTGTNPGGPQPEQTEASSNYLYGGTLGVDDPITLRKGWNWIPNPYVFRRYIINGLSGTFVEDDRIVSKEDGFAVYDDGSWTGSLEVLAPGQGYLFYNAGDAGRTISFQNELNLAAQDDDHVDRARQAGRHVARTPLYQYDASGFRDNMTIVAEVEGLQRTDGCRIYAFVNDECRGEGVAVGDRFFITVHGNSGETVSFQLHDETVGELSQIDETTRMKNMLGTVKEPFKLHKGETIMTATAITTHTSSVNGSATRTYDLNGREVSRPQKGVNIRRTADGRVMKTVVR